MGGRGVWQGWRRSTRFGSVNSFGSGEHLELGFEPQRMAGFVLLSLIRGFLHALQAVSVIVKTPANMAARAPRLGPLALRRPSKLTGDRADRSWRSSAYQSFGHTRLFMVSPPLFYLYIKDAVCAANTVHMRGQEDSPVTTDAQARPLMNVWMPSMTSKCLC